MIAALFVAKGGVYFNRPDVDPWYEERDARKYPGPYPVVAHPPCSVWSMLAPVNEKRYGHKRGEDGGCFAAALHAVRKYGGVLEHPAFSRAWLAYDIAAPERKGGWSTAFDGFGYVACVEQGHYGHPARKATWLYAVRTERPDLIWGPSTADAWVSWCQNHNSGQVRKRLSKKQAKATPLAFSEILISIARSASK